MNAIAKASTNRMSTGCAVLFALPFAGFGSFMAYQLVAMLWMSAATQSWVETPAMLTELKLKRGETQRVIAEYNYEFAGAKYTSDRVGLDDTADNVSSLHKKLYNRLNARKKVGEHVTCYVNPSDPSQAVLDRTLRPVLVGFQLVFALAFGGVGFGLIIGSLFWSRGEKKRRSKLEQFPDEPWRVRDDWAAGEVRSGGWAAVITLGVIGVIVSAIAWPAAFAVFTEEEQAEWFIRLAVCGFVACGIGLLGVFAWKLTTKLSSGPAIFRLAGPTGVVGGELAGVVLVPENLRPKKAFHVKLSCDETRTEDSGGESSTTTKTIWEDTRLVERTLALSGRESASGKRGVPVRFVVPSNCKPTDPDDDRPINWKLTVTAEVAGPDYKAQFDVPVFITADSKQGVESPVEALTDYEVHETLPEALARGGLLATQRGERELRVTKPPGQHWGLAIGLMMGGLIFGGVGVGLAFVDEWFVRILFPIAFGGAGIGMLAGAAGCLLSSSDLQIDGDRWRLKSGWYGFRGVGREFAAGDVRDVATKESMSTSDTSGTTQWNHVIARLAGGKKATLVRGITDRGVERRLVAELRRLAGLDGDAEEPLDSEEADGGGGWEPEGDLS
ncbi:MAG: DUF3592 domain-containing protein [Planctomycetota bacterium]